MMLAKRRRYTMSRKTTPNSFQYVCQIMTNFFTILSLAVNAERNWGEHLE